MQWAYQPQPFPGLLSALVLDHFVSFHSVWLAFPFPKIVFSAKLTRLMTKTKLFKKFLVAQKTPWKRLSISLNQRTGNWQLTGLSMLIMLAYLGLVVHQSSL